MKKIKSNRNNKFLLLLGLFVLISATFIIFNTNNNKFSNIPSEYNRSDKVNETFVLNKESLVGIWQDMPSMAAGWSNHYNFYPSGKYTLYYSQMDCGKSTFAESGFWEYDDQTSSLILTLKQKTIHKGGRLIGASGSCGSAKMWDGGSWVVEPVSNKQKTKIQLSIPTGPVRLGNDTVSPSDFPWYKMAVFDDQPYWRFNDEVTGSGADSFPEPSGF